MVTARIAEAILRDVHAVIPIGTYNPKYGVTISLPSVLGRQVVSQILEPEMSEEGFWSVRLPTYLVARVEWDWVQVLRQYAIAYGWILALLIYGVFDGK